jgi:RecB family exonuclease
VSAAAASYVVNGLLEAGVAVGAVKTGKAPWVHHAAFALTAGFTASALAAGMATRHRASVAALIPASVSLMLLPRLGASPLRRHAILAASAAPSYAGAVGLTWWVHGTARRDPPAQDDQRPTAA